jgi:4-hydroxy-4-methyl-2-oxoglutarate aldolase
MKVCGPAFTVQTMPRDNMLLHRAYAYAKAGDVLIANCSGFYEAGYWGDLMSLGAKTKGINGLVIDGCVRDADDIEAMGFPVFSRGLCIHGTSNYGDGTLNEPIMIGNILINSGDIVVGDRDGVVIIPQEKLKKLSKKPLPEKPRKNEFVNNSDKARRLCRFMVGMRSLDIRCINAIVGVFSSEIGVSN